MKEQKCPACKAMNIIEFTLRPGNTDPINIRCIRCKKLVLVDAALHAREQAK